MQRECIMSRPVPRNIPNSDVEDKVEAEFAGANSS